MAKTRTESAADESPSSTKPGTVARAKSPAEGNGADDAQPTGDPTKLTQFLTKNMQDPNGEVVTDIYWTTNKYQIYSNGSRIKFLLPDDYNVAMKLREQLYAIATERERIEALREHEAIRTSDKKFAERMLARCMAQAFEGHAESAKPVLQRIEGRMAAIITGHYKMKYIYANALSLIAILALLLVLIFLWPAFEGAKWFPFNTGVLVTYSKFAVFGAIGAFLSVSIGIRKIEIDTKLQSWEHMYAGSSRIIIGVIGALVIGLALESKLLSPGFGSKLDPTVYYLLAFVAGFSETLVPNALRRAEQRTEDKGSSKTSTGKADAKSGVI